MSDTNTGGQAFPQAEPIANEFHPKYGSDRGMTLRDYFAAKAMPSALAGAKLPPETWSEALPLIADFAYQMADAMIKARDEK
jgi:hypothetical protein